jgi:DNA polymerase-3 subunit gamma/tau
MRKLLALVCMLGLAGWMVGCAAEESTAPSGSGETTPATGTPEGTGGMEEPATGGTEEPATGTTEEPATGGTEEPAAGGTAEPAAGGTAEPAAAGTETP